MTDLSRIDKRFYKHPKAVAAREKEPGAISVWLFCNCWCRDHRAQGVIPKDVALEFGTEAELQALVECGLFDEDFDSYEFHDWRDWNPDLVRSTPKASSAYIVSTILGDHPGDVQKSMRREVNKLMDEGVPTPVIEDALREWVTKPDAGMSWLAFMASNAMRKRNTGIHAALKEARRTGIVSGLAEFGYQWTPPDSPPRIGAAAVREFMRKHKMAWLAQIEADIGRGSGS